MRDGFKGFWLDILVLVEVGKVIIIVVGFNGEGFEVEVFNGRFFEKCWIVLIQVKGSSEIF